MKNITLGTSTEIAPSFSTILEGNIIILRFLETILLLFNTI